MWFLACSPGGDVGDREDPLDVPLLDGLEVDALERGGSVNQLHSFESGLVTASVELEVDTVVWVLARQGGDLVERELAVVEGTSVLDMALEEGRYDIWVEAEGGRSQAVAFDVHEETPNATGALMFYFPSDPWDLKRMWMGHWGGDAAVTRVLGGSYSDDPQQFAADVFEQLEQVEQMTGGGLQVVVDVHSLQSGVASVVNELPDYCDLDAEDTVLEPGEHLSGDGLTWCEDGDTLEIALTDAEADLDFLEAMLFGDGGLLVDPEDPRLEHLAGFYVSDEPLNAVYEGVPWSSKDRDAEVIASMAAYLQGHGQRVVADYAADNVVDYDWHAYHFGEGCVDGWLAACEESWIWAYAADSSIRSPYNTDGVLGKAYGDRRLGMFGEDLAFVNHFGGPHGLSASYFSVFHDEHPDYGVVFYGGYSVEENAALLDLSVEYAPWVGVWLWQGYDEDWEIEPRWESDYAALLEALP